MNYFSTLLSKCVLNIFFEFQIPGEKERQLRKQGIMNNAISLDEFEK